MWAIKRVKMNILFPKGNLYLVEWQPNGLDRGPMCRAPLNFEIFSGENGILTRCGRVTTRTSKCWKNQRLDIIFPSIASARCGSLMRFSDQRVAGISLGLIRCRCFPANAGGKIRKIHKAQGKIQRVDTKFCLLKTCKIELHCNTQYFKGLRCYYNFCFPLKNHLFENNINWNSNIFLSKQLHRKLSF